MKSLISKCISQLRKQKAEPQVLQNVAEVERKPKSGRPPVDLDLSEIYRLQKQGLSHRQIAKKIGVSNATISRRMRGYVPPAPEPAEKPAPSVWTISEEKANAILVDLRAQQPAKPVQSTEPIPVAPAPQERQEPQSSAVPETKTAPVEVDTRPLLPSRWDIIAMLADPGLRARLRQRAAEQREREEHGESTDCDSAGYFEPR